MKTTTPLDPESTSAAIERAVGNQAQTAVESPATGGRINGRLISADCDTILVEITGRPAVDAAKLVGEQCQVQVFDLQHLQFETVINGAPAWGKSLALALVRPRTADVVERRRFRRATLAPSATLNIAWRIGGVLHRHSATLLNVSADGLACRMQAAVVGNIQNGGAVHASFELPGKDGGEEFELESIVSNKTPASEGCVILGLQFVRSEAAADQFTRLAVIVRSPGSPAEQMEVGV